MNTRRIANAAAYLREPFKYLWPITLLNAFFDRYTGGRDRPAFFDIDATFPPLNELTRHHALIKDELARILPAKSLMPRYHEVDFTQYSISGKVQGDKDWKVFMLYAMGERPAANRSLCPRTCELLEKVPDLFQAFFSILDAGKSIPRHTGPYRGYLRYHLALKVPANNPPALRVKDKWYEWKEGEAVLFDDSHHHEVANIAEEDRVVLVVDVLRPMPPLPRLINRVIALGVVRLVYAKAVIRVSPLVARLTKRSSPSVEHFR